MMDSTSLPTDFCDPALLSGLPRSTPLLVAYSGGADSTALLHMLTRYGKTHGAPVYAAHVNHGIRGDEADRDEEFCRKQAESLGVPLFVCHAHVPRVARETGESIETAARRVRYEFFDRLMKDNRIPLLATAHNADDNLETLLHHLIRGSGLHGICGIPPCRPTAYGSVVRPILSMSRAAVLSYCDKYGLSFVTDSTNTDTDYTRNHIRARVIPALRQINPAVTENASRLTKSLRADELCLESMTEMFLEGFRQGNSVELEKLCGSPEAIVSRALRQIYRELSSGALPEQTHVAALRELARRGVPHSSVSLPHGIEGVVEDGRLILRRTEKPTEIEPYSLTLTEGSNKISQTNCEIVMGPSQNAKNIYKKSILLSLDSATISGKLWVRPRMAGDRILMGGMHRSLKKLMCDKKIPTALRPRLPLICDDDGIVAVPLVGVRDGAACPPEARNACLLHFYIL